ncbi:unnamed protein product [Sympodiomycopsis kandeliae]
MKCYDRSQLVKPEVLKIHLEASSSSSKICSLYLFDAIVRHAQSIVSGKKGSIDEGEAIKLLASISKSSDPKQALVSAAEDFLDEMGTIVVDIITDTVKSVKPESRDKVEKVIEIWKKASTFKPNLLQELDSAVKFASASSSRSTHSNGASSKTSGRSSKGSHLQSTTPPRSPPPYLKERFAPGSGSTAGPHAGPPPAIGLPANLAALLGGGGNNDPNQNVDHQQQQQQQGGGGAQDFMKSLNNLIDGGGQRGYDSSQQAPPPVQNQNQNAAAPAFDLSQLTALQQLRSGNNNSASTTGPSNVQQGNGHSLPKPQGESQPPMKAANTSIPPGPPPPVVPPPSQPQPPALSWPPTINESIGTFQTFSIFDFNPTLAPQWLELGQRWFNSYGYMPTLPELGLNYLMFYQSAMMSANTTTGNEAMDPSMQMQMQMQMQAGNNDLDQSNWNGQQTSFGGNQYQ